MLLRVEIEHGLTSFSVEHPSIKRRDYAPVPKNNASSCVFGAQRENNGTLPRVVLPRRLSVFASVGHSPPLPPSLGRRKPPPPLLYS